MSYATDDEPFYHCRYKFFISKGHIMSTANSTIISNRPFLYVNRFAIYGHMQRMKNSSIQVGKFAECVIGMWNTMTVIYWTHDWM